MSPPVIAAYRYCETVTGQQARNFAYGIKLLPMDKRRAMSAIYAFARRIDDIGDGDLDTASKVQRLGQARGVLERIRQQRVAEDDTDPVAVALAHAVTRFPIPLGALDELIDGVQMDLDGAVYETWDDLRTYCRCVAGSIGRLSLGVFGTVPGAPGAERAAEVADTLGLALQLTNILRDLREDASNKRVYLPAEDLAKFSCQDGFAGPIPPHGSDFTGLVRFEARRADEMFQEGLALLPMLDRRSGACVSAMAGIYHRLLRRIARDPEAVLRGRVSLPGREKAYEAVRGLSGRHTRQVAHGTTARRRR